MMDQAEVAQLKALMEWEGKRRAPPQGFPALPDMPAGRYTSAEYFALEQEHVFRKSWLFAGHLDEIPEPGCYMRWHNAGDPIVIVHGMDGKVRAFHNTATATCTLCRADRGHSACVEGVQGLRAGTVVETSM